MPPRSLDRRTLAIIVVILAVLVALLLVVSKGNVPLFGTAGIPPVIDTAYTALSKQLGTTVTRNGNTTFNWTLGPYPDTSLGCPQPNQTYQQVQTSGYQVLINYQGATYDYRAKADGSGMFLCSTAGSPAGESASGGKVEEPVALVDAVFLDINSRNNAQLTRANSRYTYFYSTYPDTGLGCPQAGKTYAQGTTWGWQIKVMPNAGGSYDYRGFAAGNFWPCSK
jgi:hypothetical protein